MNLSESAATKWPVLREEAKKQLEIEHTDDDSYVDSLIKAATLNAEHHTGRAFINRTVTLYLDSHEGLSPIELPKAPYVSITSFETVDVDGTETDVGSSNYYIVGDNPARVVTTASGWTPERQFGAFKLVYTAGYGTNRSSVPADIRQAIKVIVSDMWHNTESMKLESRSSSFPTALPTAAVNLLSPYRLLV